MNHARYIAPPHVLTHILTWLQQYSKSFKREFLISHMLIVNHARYIAPPHV